LIEWDCASKFYNLQKTGKKLKAFPGFEGVTEACGSVFSDALHNKASFEQFKEMLAKQTEASGINVNKDSAHSKQWEKVSE
jgi:hypothetical protein